MKAVAPTTASTWWLLGRRRSCSSTTLATYRSMIEREGTSEKATPASSEVTYRAKVQSKKDEKRAGFDALADEEPQICRGID